MISKHRLIKIILKDPDFNKSIRLLSDEMSKSVSRLKRKSLKILRIMSADYDPSMMPILSKFTRWILKYIYSGIETNQNGLERVRDIAKNNTVILVPSHKSHVDYIVISYLFFLNKIQVPLVASGLNMSFWPLGYIFRKAGAFFIKRKIKGDKLYSLVLKYYLKFLYEKKYTQEVFLEGTRSRSGKLLLPKTGILSMIVDNYVHSKMNHDVSFIPVSINYERIVEEKSFGDEQGGISKTKETLLNLLKSIKILKGKYGKIYVNFGHPISLKESVQKRANISEHFIRETTDTIGQHLIKAIGNIMTVTTSSLLATSILTYKNNGTSSDELLGRINFLNSYLALKKAPLTGSATNIEFYIEEILTLFRSSGTIFQYEDREGKIFVPKKRHRLRMSYYKNSAIHYFVEIAIIITIVKRFKATNLEDILVHYSRICGFFKNEFVGLEIDKQTLINNINDLKTIEIIANKSDPIELNNSIPHDIVEMLDSMLQNYFEGYYIVADTLLKSDINNLPDDLLKRFREAGLRFYYKGKIKCFDAITHLIFKNSLIFFNSIDENEIAVHREYLSNFLLD